MKIAINFGPVVGWKLHDLTETEIMQALGRQPFYRDKVYSWQEATDNSYDQTCRGCVVEFESPSTVCCGYCQGVWKHRLKPFKFSPPEKPEWFVV